MDRALNVTRTFTPQGGVSSQRQTLSQKNAPSRGPRPKEVPMLELERLGDREVEDGAFITVAGNPSSLLSAMSWGTAASAHQPQNMSERNPSLFGYQSPHSSCRGQPLSRPPSNHQPNMETLYIDEHSQTQTYTIHTRSRKLEAEGLTVEKRKQAVIEQMMVDQLSRAVISDPEQNTANQFDVSARHRRTLHHTMVKTQKSLTENLLSHKLCFHARILSRCGREACRELTGFFFTCDHTLTVYEYRSFGKNRCSALPFIARGVYRTRGRPYCLADLSRGTDLRFSTDMPHLPESLRQRPYLTLRVTDVDEETKGTLLAQSGEREYCLSEEEINDQKTLRAVQVAVRDRLRGRAISTLISLGRRLKSLDTKNNSLIGKDELRECLMEELSLTKQDFDAVWRIVGQQGGPLVDYAEMMRAVTGEMSEIRKAIFIKVYVKLDPNKTGYVSLIDIEKFYSAKVNLHLEHDMEAKIDILSCIQDTGRVTKDVSYAEFEDYYEGLSIEISSDQEYINILKSTWSI
ncbi:calcyphosin-2 isoform X2 [Colossoma macropomum]|uniref:calcyphosin-2 isoform X2 n=1 Tax=Colossoma macropomum TaxID=42526 RepID=UPI001864285A|nr:calcyphosin-2 isoform X2 [Colossoma macropomum]